jgi:Flp pilus assembly protein TadG
MNTRRRHRPAGREHHPRRAAADPAANPAPDPAANPATDGGSASAETAVLAVPLLILLTLFLVLCGRGATAAIDVTSAAGGAARAASLAATPGGARTAAGTSVAGTAAGQHWTCAADTDTGAFRPGGQVTVTLTCAIPLADLGLPIRGSRTVTARSTQPVDTWRSAP